MACNNSHSPDTLFWINHYYNLYFWGIVCKISWSYRYSFYWVCVSCSLKPNCIGIRCHRKPWIPLIAKIVGLCVFFLTCFLTVTWLGERGLALASLFGIVSIALFQVS